MTNQRQEKLRPLDVFEMSIETLPHICILLSRDKYPMKHCWDSKGYYTSQITFDGWLWCVAGSYAGMGGSHHFLTDEEVLQGKYLGNIMDFISSDLFTVRLPKKEQHAQDCLYMIETRYRDNPTKEKYCNCGAFDKNQALEEIKQLNPNINFKEQE